jgi:hypothetical protein
MIRKAFVALLVVGLGVSGWVGYRLFTEEPRHDPPSSRAVGTTDDGWQQVTYRGVDLEVPPDWTRLDMAGCEFSPEHWGPAALDPCADDVGLWFWAAASFDPATGPGVHVAAASANLPDGGWAGYVTSGDVAVDVGFVDQAVVRRILQSVSERL